MGPSKAEKAIWQLAQKEGVSVDDIRREIEIVITAASNSEDPEARAFWRSIPRKGDRPTPEEAIAHIMKKMGPARLLRRFLY